jgi:hypothetical protein
MTVPTQSIRKTLQTLHKSLAGAGAVGIFATSPCVLSGSQQSLLECLISKEKSGFLF